MPVMTISFCARAYRIVTSQPADLHRLQYEKASVVRGYHIYKSLWRMKYFCYGEKLAMSMMSMQLLSYSSYLGLPFSLLRCQLEGERVAVPRVSMRERDDLSCSQCLQLPHPFPKPHPRPLLNCT